MTPRVIGKLEELKCKVVRTSSYYFVHNREGEVIKVCHGCRSLADFVHREYRIRFSLERSKNEKDTKMV